MSSTTSSLVGYENNNDINRGKMKQPNKVTQKPTSASSKRRARCVQIHFNSLWSLWYGVFGTLLQGYTAVKCIKRILGKCSESLNRLMRRFLFNKKNKIKNGVLRLNALHQKEHMFKKKKNWSKKQQAWIKYKFLCYSKKRLKSAFCFTRKLQFQTLIGISTIYFYTLRIK